MDSQNNMEITYDIKGIIGGGSGGTVYLAYHKRLQKKVILKKIRSEITNLIDCRAEADILKNLKCEFIPQVYDFIETTDGIYTVMDYVEGASLQQMLDAGHHFTENDVLKYGIQLCEAVSYLHRQPIPIVHGDIKPENIMLTPEGNICLIDFNISGFSSGKGVRVIGYTPGYASPEQEKDCNGSDKKDVVVDYRSDIYSIGATLYSLFYRKKLEADSRIVLRYIRSKSWREIISIATKKKKEKRYQSADALEEAVKHVNETDKELKSLYKRNSLKLIAYGILVVLFAGMSYIGGNMADLGKNSFIPVKEAWHALIDGDYSNGTILVLSGCFLLILSAAGLLATLISYMYKRERVLHVLRVR